MSLKRRNTRFIEISTGFFLLSSVLSVLVSFLLNFDYTIPNATFKEDLDFLKENISSQRISAISWIIAGIFNLFLLPFILILLQRFLKWSHIFVGLLILTMAFCFFSVGMNGLYIARASENYLNYPDLYMHVPTLVILPNIKLILEMHRIAISAFGVFLIIAALIRFKIANLNFLGSLFSGISGPLIIACSWLNTDHVLLTVALAMGWTGLLMIGSKLINRGLTVYEPSP